MDAESSIKVGTGVRDHFTTAEVNWIKATVLGTANAGLVPGDR
ncbi:hypothetical protein [Enterovibrio calviensis]|nr:hypothetical protein [Enterovibrio calviensis]